MRPLTLPRRSAVPEFTSRDESGRRTGLQTYRARQRNLLLLLLHGAACAACARIAEELIDRRLEVEEWDSEILVIRSGGEPFPTSISQALDSEAIAQNAYDPHSDAVIAVLDFRGRLMDGWSLRHPEPVDWREVTETVRWVATQEPECGTCVIAPGWDE